MCRPVWKRWWIAITLAGLLSFTGSALAQTTNSFTYTFPKFTDSFNSRFLIGVLGDRPASIRGTFYGANGDNAQHFSFEVPAGVIRRVGPDDLKSQGVSDFSGAVVFSSSQALSMMETLEDPNGAIENIAPSVFSNRLIVPFSKGAGGSVDLSLFNPDGVETEIIVAAIGASGHNLGFSQLTLGPHSTLNATLDSLVPDLVQGGNRPEVSHVLLFTPTSVLGSERGLHAIATLTGFASEAEGVVARTDPAVVNALPISNTSTSSTVPFFVQGGDFFSMVQVINASISENIVTLTARDTNGNVIPAERNPATFSVPPDGSIRMNASNVFRFVQDFANGSISISSTMPSIVSSAIGSGAERAFAVSPGVSTDAAQLVFATRAALRTYTGIALKNSNTDVASLTITFFSDTGFSLAQTSASIRPGATLTRMISDWFPRLIADGFIHIQSNVPILGDALEGRNDGSQLTAIPVMQTQSGFRVPSLSRFSAAGTLLHEGVPLSNASVQISGPVTFFKVTDSNGAFIFENLPPGTYSIQPQVVGYTFSPAQIAVTIGNEASRNNNFSAALVRPVIRAISPRGIIVNSSTTQVTISGGPFLPTSVVSFEGRPLPTIAGSNSNAVTATFDASLLQVVRQADLTVTNTGPGGSITSAPVLFAIEPPPPVIEGQSGVPVPLLAGSPEFVMTLTGSNFANGAIARIGNQAVPSVVLSSTVMLVTVPAPFLVTEGILTVTVVNPPPSPGISNAITLVVRTPAPILVSISPEQATVLLAADALPIEMTIVGSGFLPRATLLVGNVEVPTNFISSTLLTASVPVQALQVGGVLPISVRNPAPTLGTSDALPFLLYNLQPVLSVAETAPLTYDSTRPAETYVARIVLRGNNFGPNTVAEVNSPCAGMSGFQPTITSFIGPQEVVATVTIGCVGTYQLRVQTPAPGGGTSQAVSFAVTEFSPQSLPRITSLSTSSTAAGTGTFSIIISGTNFSSGAVVLFGTATLIPTSITPTRITVTIPSSLVQTPRTVQISVANPNSVAPSNQVSFRIF